MIAIQITDEGLFRTCTGIPCYLTNNEIREAIAALQKNIEFNRRNNPDDVNQELMRQTLLPRPTQPKEDYTPAVTSIYVMRDFVTGCCKIGHSLNPTVRESTLFSEKPHIELLFSFQATRQAEKELHEHFSEKRIRGEWFMLNEDDIQFVKEYGEVLA